MTTTKKTHEQLADWAENDMVLPEQSGSAKRGEAAAEAGRELLRRSAGRPSLSPGSVSPRRQVRLPEEVSRVLDEIAEREHRKASELMREAITEYVHSRSV